MPRKTHLDWHKARVAWESTSGMGYAAVARELGVSAPTVFVRAQKEAWTKLLPEVPVDDLAQVRADVRQALVEQATELVRVESQEVLDFSVASRVAVINRARVDWMQHRALFPPEACAQDPVAAKRGKLTAEMLAIRQRGEAIAYGLVTYTGQSTDAPLVDEVPAEDKLTPFQRKFSRFLETGDIPGLDYNPREETE